MTQVYTFDDVVIIQQTGSEHVDSLTGIEICKLNEEGWAVKNIQHFPDGKRCYVIMERYVPEPEPQEVINGQWNLVRPYMAEIHDDQGVF